MNSFEQLIHKAQEKQYRLSIRFEPARDGEEWRIRLYPHEDDAAHYWAIHTRLEEASRLILDEIEGFSS